MHVSRTVSLALTLTSLCALGAGFARPAHAQLQVTLDNPNQVYDTSMGTTVLNFTGTIQNLTNDTQVVSAYGINPPLTDSGQAPTFRNGNDNNVAFASPPMSFAPGSNYQGFLFSFTLDQTTAPGFYHLTLDGRSQLTLPSRFLAQATDSSTGIFFNNGAAYSIRVTASPVPETSTTVSFGLLLALGLGGLVLAARRKKAAAPIA